MEELMNSYSINLEDFYIVKKDVFLWRAGIIMSLFPSGIILSKKVFDIFDGCIDFQILVAKQKKQIVLKKAKKSDEVSVSLSARKGSKTGYYKQKFKCASFTKSLYSTWQFKENTAYKSIGRKMKASGEEVLLFDFGERFVYERKIGELNV